MLSVHKQVVWLGIIFAALTTGCVIEPESMSDLDQDEVDLEEANAETIGTTSDELEQVQGGSSDSGQLAQTASKGLPSSYAFSGQVAQGASGQQTPAVQLFPSGEQGTVVLPTSGGQINLPIIASGSNYAIIVYIIDNSGDYSSNGGSRAPHINP
ncbi:hypothetical protein WME73_07340 [Sorangium sp. So ce302]|uniref:hypothetical protein n=1 Tax=Sorangium sp. So ce302 TaxID=3133297 RepID=UPI003F5EED00